MTSEQLTVTAVDPDRIVASTGAGRTVTLTGTAIDAEHLDHAYALTVHRAQGATYGRAHVLAAGGGRELAYVALSRARDHTTLHATADDLAQAVDDLQADWGVERHQRWITQTPAAVGHHPEPVSAPVLVPERGQSAPVRTRSDAHAQVGALEADYRDLWAGTGRWANTPEGQAARRLSAAREHLTDAEMQATSRFVSRRDRKAAARSLAGLRIGVARAEERWTTIGQPVADKLTTAVNVARQEDQSHETAELLHRLDAVQSSRGRDMDRSLGLGR